MSELAKALVNAQQSAQAVHKDSRNEWHKYAYASAEAIISEARTALSCAGLALLPVSWSVVDGARVRVKYRLVHISGESMDLDTETSVVPEKGRPQDKAEACALTYSLSYLLRGLLLLPRVEDEPDRRDDRPSESKAQDSKPATAQVTPLRRDWEMFTLGILGRLAAAATSTEVTAVAKEVHEAKPPKVHRDRIAQAYQTKVAQLSAEAHGA